MSIEGWQYYNHARIPTAPPTVPAAVEAMAEEGFWHDSRGTVLLARWTSEFDCRRETGWWYIIKDTPLDMDAMKAKRRYEITKGQKHFQVRPIVPKEYGQALYRVEQAAFAAYPAKYRPQVDWDTFAAGLPNWEDCLVYGAFSRETGELAGYGLLRYAAPDFLDFLVLEADPAYATSILAIGRGGRKPRKDLATWKDARDYMGFFYDEYLEQPVFDAKFDKAVIADVLKRFLESFDMADDSVVWFNKVKAITEAIGFTTDMKAYKQDPEAYPGTVADVSTFLRLAVTGKTNSPDLYTVMQLLGKDRTTARIHAAMETLA